MNFFILSSINKWVPPIAAIKIDLNKAYDCLKWDFIKAVLRQVGFPKLWIFLLMECITTVSYSVLINGKPSPVFKPMLGIQQEDPLSLYIFILCIEVLSDLLLQAQEHRYCLGIKILRYASFISHLLFVDDSFFFLQHLCNYINARISTES